MSQDTLVMHGFVRTDSVKVRHCEVDANVAFYKALNSLIAPYTATLLDDRSSLGNGGGVDASIH
jgi:hypothetical protein